MPGAYPAVPVEDSQFEHCSQGVQHARAAQSHRLRAAADDVDFEAAILRAHALDRAFGGAHARPDVPAFQRRPRGAGDAADAVAMDERDFGVGADVHDDRGGLRPAVLGGEEDRDVIAADVAAYIGQQMHVGARRGGQAEIARLDVDRRAHRRYEGRTSELRNR